MMTKPQETELLAEEKKILKKIHGKTHISINEKFQIISFKLIKLTQYGLKTNNVSLICRESIFIIIWGGKSKLTTYKTLSAAVEALIKKVNNQRATISAFIERINTLEDSLLDLKTQVTFTSVWFRLRKDISHMERILMRNTQVFRQYLEYTKKDTFHGHMELMLFVENQDYDYRSCQTESQRLDHLYNFFTSIKNDRINNNLYLLTIVSGLFLPLNLVVGFFGMNTTKLFFSELPNGTYIVSLILIFIFTGLVIAPPVVIWLYRKVISKLLSSINLYSGLLEKIPLINSENHIVQKVLPQKLKEDSSPSKKSSL